MAIYSFENVHFCKIEETTFSSERIKERQHIQAALKKQIDIIDPDCMVISEEFSEWEDSLRRIDLLAINKKGNLVVIELKRNDTGEHMELQAIRYAAMISTLTFTRTIEIYQKYLDDNGIQENARDSLLNFLDWEGPQEDKFALDIEIILVSADFSKELTTAVLWLREKEIDIKCVRFFPYKNNDQILVDVEQVIPFPEAEDYQIKIREQTEIRRDAKQSDKDYSKYEFDNSVYNKRKLVLAIIKKWCMENNPKSIDDLLQVFPQSIHAGSMFVPIDEAREIYTRQGIYRHFIASDDVIHFSNGSTYAVSNQWGKGNIEKVIEVAKHIGYVVNEIE